MTENEKKVNDQHSDDEERGNKQDYNKMVGQQPAGTTAGDTIASSRDLGSIGGGSVPEPRNPSMGSGKSPGGMNTANSTVDSGSTTGRGMPGAEQTTDRGSETMNDIAGGRANTIDRHAQGNIGGRHPSEPETPLGDRDTRSGREVRGESDISDPMTSRHPSKVNQDTSAHSDEDQQPQK
ncbi:MAG: hypothetical protein E6I59_05445 [Chloroflexi bacterium]|nr:MAG: hypothetical protein E6I59_05445 [Chloroflexota bacterium]